MKKKGFTLVELLVVISIIALLMAILMPALSKVKVLAYQMICGTHLSGIGKGMTVYAAENKDRYPRASHGYAGIQSRWTDTGVLTGWNAPGSMKDAYGELDPMVTITACFYLLVKYAEVQPDLFYCKGDSLATEFSLSDEMSLGAVKAFPDAWDFGSQPGMHCSYSYHQPIGNSNSNAGYPLNSTSNGGSPLCADRNPRQDINAFGVYLDGAVSGQNPPKWTGATPQTPGGYTDTDKTGNSALHQREGQNVLFVDGHVVFAKLPNVGLAQDHIYKMWGTPANSLTQQIREGAGAGSWGAGAGVVNSERDAHLIGESNTYTQPGGYKRFP